MKEATQIKRMRTSLTSTIALMGYLDRLQTPASGRRLVEKAYRESPVRKVRSNGVSVVGDVQSEKMGQPIPYESRTLEYPAIVFYEHNEDVLAYFAQPFHLDLKLTDGGTKRPYRRRHVPDFLVLRQNGIFVEEWKEPSRLQRILCENPGRLSHEQDGWHWPEVEARLADLGFTYRLLTRDTFSETYLANLRFLADYFLSSSPDLSAKASEAISQAFAQTLSMPLCDLIGMASSERPRKTGHAYDLSATGVHATEAATFTTDDVYKGIALNKIGFNLAQDLLSEPQRALVYRDDVAREFCTRESSTLPAHGKRRDFNLTLGSSVLYDGRSLEVAFVGETRVLLRGSDTEYETEVLLSSVRRLFEQGHLTLVNETPPSQRRKALFLTPNPTELKIALARARQLEAAKISPEHVMISQRTIQRYRRAVAQAGDTAIEQNLALVPNFRARGNRNPKLPPEVIRLIEHVAREHFNTAAGITKRMAYNAFVDACESAGQTPCSERIFNIRIGLHANLEKRVGRRLADKATPLPINLEFREPVHGVRAWEYVHFDHTELDLELLEPSGEHLRKAWLSLAICAATRRIVGFYLSFSSPSYVSCMMLLRDIVRRYGRLPEMVVVDNGTDFRSASFMRVLQLYGVHQRWRPKGKPRYGSVMERVFGVANSQFLHNLRGNTKLMKHARLVTRSVNPNAHVEWTLVALHGALDFYFEKLYGNEVHPAYNETPNDRFNRLVHEAGARTHKWVRYDKLFRIETCPEPDAGCTRVVDQVRGIKVNNTFYACGALATPSIHGTKVQVRIEPWDPSIVYALINGAWHTCRSRSLAKFDYASELELRYALQEAAKRSGLARRNVTPERAREWLQILKAENFDPRLRLRQNEMRIVYAPLNMLVADTESVEVVSGPEPEVVPKAIDIGAPTELGECGGDEDNDEFGLLY